MTGPAAEEAMEVEVCAMDRCWARESSMKRMGCDMALSQKLQQ